MTAPVPIAVQVAEVERELIARDRVYPALVDRGRLTSWEAAQRVVHLQAALATLRTVQRHAEGLRALIRFLAAADLAPGETPNAEERAALLAHPAVASLVAAFPEAELAAARPITFPAPELDPFPAPAEAD